MLRQNHVIENVNKRFILELNSALAMENAGIERLQAQISGASLPEAKQQLQRHFQETKQHQKNLQELISSIGGSPTTEKIRLPLPTYPKKHDGDDE